MTGIPDEYVEKAARIQKAVARRDAALVYGAASNAELLTAKAELRAALAEGEPR